MPKKLKKLRIDEVSHVYQGANPDARALIWKRRLEKDDSYSCPECDQEFDSEDALKQHMSSEHSDDSDAQKDDDSMEKIITKTEGGQEYPKSAYAYTPSDEPSSWKLRLWQTPDSKETASQVGRAVAALGKGFRGQKAQIPSSDLPAVKARVRAAWKKTNPDKDTSDLPPVLKAELPRFIKLAARLTGQDLEEIRKEYEMGEEEEFAKDQLIYIDDDDDLVSDLRQLLGVDPPEDEEEDEEEGCLSATIHAPLDVNSVASVLSAVGKAGRKISSRRLAHLKDAHEKIGGVITEAEASPVDEADVKKTTPKEGDDMSEQTPVPEAGSASRQDDIYKNLDPEVAEFLRKRDEENESLRSEVAKMQEERETAVQVAKATSFKNLSLDNDETGAVLYRIAKGNTKDGDYEAIVGILTAADTALGEANVYAEFGKIGREGGSDFSGGGDAYEQLEAIAKGYRESDPALDKASAMLRAYDLNPELYQSAQQEMRQQATA